MSDPKETSATQTTTRTLKGSCHCGAVVFEADVDLAKGTTRCNCTLCQRTGNWGAGVKPDAFRLLQGRSELLDYQRGPKTTHFYFCKHCGVRPFGEGDAPWMGGPYVSVNLNCVDDLDTKGITVLHFDGRHDSWMSPRVEVLG